MASLTGPATWQRLTDIVTALNSGTRPEDIPEYDADATSEYDEGGTRVLVFGGHVVRKTGPNPTALGAYGDIPWPGDYPQGLWCDVNES
jgi:hypothetical protein